MTDPLMLVVAACFVSLLLMAALLKPYTIVACRRMYPGEEPFCIREETLTYKDARVCMARHADNWEVTIYRGKEIIARRT